MLFYRLRKRDRQGEDAEKGDGQMRKGLLDRTPAQTITIVTKGSGSRMGLELKAVVIGLGRGGAGTREREKRRGDFDGKRHKEKWGVLR